MRVPQSRGKARAGFTLIELLVVIAIIAILMALTGAAVFGVMRSGSELQNRNDIQQLTSAVGAFKSKFNVPPPPSRIVLRSKLTDYGTSQLEVDSRDYLLRMFPSCRGAWNNGGFAWGPTDGAVLSGDQCLVFFLGGINGNQGFSANPNNPTQAGGNRIDPFFEFKENRLVATGGFGTVASANTPNGFRSYTDVYGTPIVYLSSYKQRNGYNRYGSSDSPLLSAGAYQSSSGNFQNADTFQIISAGANKAFGSGGQWTPQSAGSIGIAGKDDMSNFYDLKLGISQ